MEDTSKIVENYDSQDNSLLKPLHQNYAHVVRDDEQDLTDGIYTSASSVVEVKDDPDNTPLFSKDYYGTDSLLTENTYDNEGSLLNGVSVVLSESASDSNGSLLDSVADTASFVELNNDVMSQEEIEQRKKFFSDPKNQADILYENYIRDQHILLNRQQRRNTYNQFLKNAKKGIYKKIFNEQIYGISKEKADENFGKLN